MDSPTAVIADLVSAADPEVTAPTAELSQSPRPEPCLATEGGDARPTAESPVASPLAVDSLTAELAGYVSAADPEATALSPDPSLSPEPVSHTLIPPTDDNLDDTQPPGHTARPARGRGRLPSNAASRKSRNTRGPISRLFWRPDMTLAFMEHLKCRGLYLQ